MNFEIVVLEAQVPMWLQQAGIPRNPRPITVQVNGQMLVDVNGQARRFRSYAEARKEVMAFRANLLAREEADCKKFDRSAEVARGEERA